MTPDDSRLFIADIHPGLGAYLARRHESGYDAVAGRTRFLLWLAAHVDGDDLLRTYLARAAQAPPLTPESEDEMTTRALAGRRAVSRLTEGGTALPGAARAELERVALAGAQAGDQLVEANLHLVVAMARRFAGRGRPLADLVREGHRGLVRAMENYDPAKGYRFGTYASWWIRQGISQAVAGHPHASPAPAPEAGPGSGPAPGPGPDPGPGGADVLAEAERRMLRELGREPSPEEIATELALSRISHVVTAICECRGERVVQVELRADDRADDPIVQARRECVEPFGFAVDGVVDAPQSLMGVQRVGDAPCCGDKGTAIADGADRGG